MTAKKKTTAGKRASGEALEVAGFRAAGIHCGVKARGRDLALIVSDRPANVAGVFTLSTVVGAPVEWCRALVLRGVARGVVVNSGISNVAMGARGRRAARAMATAAANAVGGAPEEYFVASTGVIGEPLPMPKLRAGIPRAAGKLREDGLADAADAIRTTDTFSKVASVRVKVGGREVTVAGIAKGSGMIEPNMATMLGFLITDAAASPAHLRRVLRASADESFNRVTVDGETSTSDTVLLFANGAAGNPRLTGPSSRGARAFAGAVSEVSQQLARDLARDGEGATKLVTVDVTGAASAKEAERAARRIANSMLVKTAIFGRDPNWGRILQTVGAARVAIRLDRAVVKLGGVAVFRNGASAGPAARRKAAARLAADEIHVELALGAGRGKARIWTCDLTYDYVKINAEYTT
jgi:glutamate N-acetyltransferase/amino-acid N-acetyltransferase